MTEFTSASTSGSHGGDSRNIRRAARQLLVGGLQGSMIAAVPAVVGTAVVGRAHLGSSLAGVGLGAGLAMAVFALPPLILRTSSQSSPSAVMALALAGYGGTVVALAAAWEVVAGWSAVSSPAVGAGLVVATVGAVVGQIRASTRWRLPAFGAAVD